MGITPAERKSYDDRVRETREEYENRESEILRRRNDDLKNLERRHREELTRMADEYERQLGTIQDRNRETLSERDLKHRQDMEEMKGLYMGQLRKKMEENGLQRKELEQSYRSDLQKHKQVNESQRSNLTFQQQEELARRDERFEETVREMREGMKEGVDRTKERLQASHDKEKDVLRKGKEDLLVRQERDKRELAKSYEGRLKHEKAMRNQDNENWSSKYYDTIGSMKEEFDERYEGQRGLLKQEVVNQRDKYQRKLEEKSAALDESNEVLRDGVLNRQNTQIRSRDSQIQALENKLNQERSRAERRLGAERSNILHAYENRFKDLERQKNSVVKEMNDLSGERIERLRGQNDDLMKTSNLEHRNQSTLANIRNREERAMLLENHKERLDHANDTAEKRIQQLQKAQTQENKALDRYYGRTLETMKDGYATKLDDQRNAQLENQSKAVGTLQTRFKDMQRRYEKRMEQTVDVYEQKLAELKEKQDVEMRRLQANFDERLTAEKKGRKLEVDSMEQKYESRMALAKERHQEEIDKVQKRHEEEIRVAVNRASSYSRKA
ncbi:MAG: hypothetical protein KF789_05945 [Bdellovibrionaceae bacterium]|nr:hypothetical protein [Pseudobdellovibrionaceae bacterium]